MCQCLTATTAIVHTRMRCMNQLIELSVMSVVGSTKLLRVLCKTCTDMYAPRAKRWAPGFCRMHTVAPVPWAPHCHLHYFTSASHG
jgi:hypothetical protein